MALFKQVRGQYYIYPFWQSWWCPRNQLFASGFLNDYYLVLHEEFELWTLRPLLLEETGKLVALGW